MKKLFWLLGVLIIATSCKDFKEIAVTSVNSFKINKLDMKSVDGTIEVNIHNPNNICFTVYKSKADVLVGGTKIGEARIKKKVRIQPNSSAAHTFILQGDLKGINIGSLMGIVSGKPLVEVKGYLRAGKWFFKKKFPFEQKQKISRKDMGGLLPF
ncbi:MAG: LEA type 2 family protein [Bacteroidetes bacterium]|nr:LEA type 2 family protein [Bacteroidota bacterium]